MTTNYTTRDQFKADYSFPLKTESYKFNSAELKTLIDQAYDLYSQPGLNYNKIFVSAGHFEFAVNAVIELSKDGFTYPEKRKPLHSGPNYAFYLEKPLTLQNEDKEFIKDMVMANYIAAVEQNEKAYKVRLKQQMINEAQAAEAKKLAEAEAKKQAKFEQEAEKAFQQVLEQEGIQ